MRNILRHPPHPQKRSDVTLRLTSLATYSIQLRPEGMTSSTPDTRVGSTYNVI